MTEKDKEINELRREVADLKKQLEARPEVARCKDCKYHTPIIDDMTNLYVCGVFTGPTKDSDYCSYGEKL